MSAEPAYGPGRDEDPAQHAPGPMDDAPLPGCNPDWMDDAEWAANMSARETEDEPDDPDLYPDPDSAPPLGEDGFSTAELIAEAREITAAEARDREYAARMVHEGGFGLTGAAPGRRGPGQPGSAKSFPGEHASPAAAFGSGLALDIAPGCAVLAEFAGAVAGEDDRYPGATDDEIIGVICAWSRTEAHAAARKLAAVAEFIRRRPAKDSAPNDPAENTAPDPAKAAAAKDDAPQDPAKAAAAKDRTPQDPAKAAATEDGAPPDPAKGAAAKGASQNPAKGGTAEDASKRSAAEDPAGPAKAAARMPEAWHEFAVEELSCALAETKPATEGLLDLAYDLAARLPGTMAALWDGVISQAKAGIISTATSALDPDEAAAAEKLVLDRAGRLTPPGLRAAIARAVMEVAPKKARKRREEAARQTRVERWMEDSGNAGLAGRELRPADVMAADQRINAWAKELRAAGLDGNMDVLRARAYLDVLLGMDSRPAPPTGKPPAAKPSTTKPSATKPSATKPSATKPPAAGPLPAGFAGRLNLTVTLPTLLGLADRPGEAGMLGPIDPWLARDLAHAAALHPKTTWCLTVTDSSGHAVGHGCARPAPKDPRTPGTKQQKPSSPTGPDPPGGIQPRACRPASPTAPDPWSPNRPGFSFTAIDEHGPPGGYGTWRLSTGIPGQRDLVFTLGPVATDECDHRHEAPGHDPGVLLRHLTEVRHATCTAPTCRRPASRCDFEHNIPFETGGRTCMCNGGPKCRYHHRLKQDPRWKVEQPAPAIIRWRTPAGRLYSTEPTRYPT
jgi:hypothetical protein